MAERRREWLAGACGAAGAGHNGGVSTSSLPTLPAAPAPGRPDVTARLREALIGASFTADGLLELLGAPAYAALARSETVPALRATREDSPWRCSYACSSSSSRCPTRAWRTSCPSTRVWRAAGWSASAAMRWPRRWTYGRTADPVARTGSSCRTSAVPSAARAASAAGTRVSSSASAVLPRPWPASPSVPPSPPPSISVPAPGSRPCTPYSTPRA